jgi:beta-galactosidase
MNKKTFSKLFPIGSHLCREPMPEMSEMKRDMENLKQHGFNFVNLQEQWAYDEPREGQYDFSKYEELIAHAAQLDLGVYLGFTMEQAPHWLWEKHPGCRMIRRDGLAVVYEAQSPMPSDGKPGPCYDHEGAEADSLRFLRKAVEVLGKYENIVVWNAWQEIGIWSDTLVGQSVCYCEHTIRAFREWLKQKYGELDAINRAWKMRYPDWELVVPNRKYGSDSCMPHDIEWRQFIQNVRLTRIIERRAQVIREADSLKRPVFAHMATTMPGSGAEWSFARAGDFLGSSSYPTCGSIHQWDDANVEQHDDVLLNEMWMNVALRFDYLHSANPFGAPVWVAELQGGPVTGGILIGRIPNAKDIRRWMLTAVGSGVTAISFWVTRAEIAALELNGFGLLDSVGDETERFAEAGHIAQALNKHSDVFNAPTTERAKIAILIDDVNFRYCSAAQIQEYLTYSIRGWHRLLWDNNIPVDFVEASELSESYIKDYRVIIMPFPYAMRNDTAEHLVHYVETGGNLVSEACPGRCDGYGYAVRGEMTPVLRTLFGSSQRSLENVREPRNEKRWTHSNNPGVTYRDDEEFTGTGRLKGVVARANLYTATFHCDTSEPCLIVGDSVAGTVRTVGDGSAWLLGTFVGFSGTAYVNEKSHTFVRKLLVENGVEPEYNGALKLRKRTIAGKEAWLITNPGSKSVTETINAPGFSQAEDILGGKIHYRNGKLRLTVGPLDVRAIVLTNKT